MKAVIQRVKNADVAVNGETVGKCGNGLMVLFGAETGDTVTGVQTRPYEKKGFFAVLKK